MAENTEGVKYEEEFIINRRGMKLFTCRWFPANQDPTGLVFLCHGYAMECSISMKGNIYGNPSVFFVDYSSTHTGTGIRLAQAGLAVHGIDYEGHGKSSGLLGFVSSFDEVVGDCCDFFSSISQRKENKSKKRFLLGESMGGAVSLLVHRRMPAFWDGAVLVAPMCKIADEMKPSPLLISILTKLCSVIPTWKIIPTQDVIDAAIKEPKRREEVRSNPYCYKGRPRLKTGYELLKVSMKIEQSLHEVTLPFLIVHGEADKVTNPSVSKLLVRTASSTDKTLKLYPGMWHALTSGEPPENIDLVFSDILNWLGKRVTGPNPRFECESKSEHEVPIATTS